MTEEIKVLFESENLEVFGKKGTTIAELARESGINIYKPCGGEGTCGKCKVQVQNAKLKPNKNELIHLKKHELENNYRLACQSLIEDNMIVKIIRDNSSKETKILSNKENLENIIINPYVKTKRLKINLKESQKDIKSLLDLIIFSLNVDGIKMNIDAIRDLSNIYNPYSNELIITVIYNSKEIIAIEKEELVNQYGIGIDIGTTSVVAYLVDVLKREQIAISSKLNPQVEYGDDVISRINYINRNPKGLEKLNKVILNTINGQIDELCKEANIQKDQVYEIAINGNTIMQHIFLGVNPKSIGLSPYIPTFHNSDRVKAKDIGIEINRAGIVTILPNISGYVGSDVLAGAYSVDISGDEKIKVVIDIGTNNEIIIGNKNFIMACASAAGPAFEGARISSGMRGTLGAIEHFRYLEDKVNIQVIGDVSPLGICGSGIIDLMSELLRIGVVDPTGKITNNDDEDINNRIEQDSNGAKMFRVTDNEDDENIYMTQKDIREIQLAKGAVLAGLKIMLKEANLTTEDIDTIYLAGAFGNYIDEKCAINIGLLPEIDSNKVEMIGNSSAFVASVALLSENVMDEMTKLAMETEYIELSTHPDFQKEFIDAIAFPKDIKYKTVG